MKFYLIVMCVVFMFVYAIYQEIAFAKRCGINLGTYKIGRMSLCLCKDGRILETL